MKYKNITYNMKYIKTFEDQDQDQENDENYIKLKLSKHPKFKVNDYVYAIEPTIQLKKDTKYQIAEIDYSDNIYSDVYPDKIHYELKEFPDSMYQEKRFMSEQEYKLKNNINKYNL